MKKGKISKQRAFIIKSALAMLILVAPIANTYGYFSQVLPLFYGISIICVIGFLIVEFYTEK